MYFLFFSQSRVHQRPDTRVSCTSPAPQPADQKSRVLSGQRRFGAERCAGRELCCCSPCPPSGCSHSARGRSCSTFTLSSAPHVPAPTDPRSARESGSAPSAPPTPHQPLWTLLWDGGEATGAIYRLRLLQSQALL